MGSVQSIRALVLGLTLAMAAGAAQAEGDPRDQVAVPQRCLGSFAGLANDTDGFLGAP